MRCRPHVELAVLVVAAFCTSGASQEDAIPPVGDVLANLVAFEKLSDAEMAEVLWEAQLLPDGSQTPADKQELEDALPGLLSYLSSAVRIGLDRRRSTELNYAALVALGDYASFLLKSHPAIFEAVGADVLRLTKSTDDRTAIRAIRTLETFPVLTSDAEDRLFELFDSSKGQKLQTVLNALLFLSSTNERVCERTATKFGDRRSEVRAAMLNRAGALRCSEAEVIRFVTMSMSDPELEVRRAAVRSLMSERLGTLLDEEGAAQLRSIVLENSESIDLRIEASRSMARIEPAQTQPKFATSGPRVATVARELASDESLPGVVRSEFLRGIPFAEGWGPHTLAFLSGFAASPDPNVASAAKWGIGVVEGMNRRRQSASEAQEQIDAEELRRPRRAGAADPAAVGTTGANVSPESSTLTSEAVAQESSGSTPPAQPDEKPALGRTAEIRLPIRAVTESTEDRSTWRLGTPFVALLVGAAALVALVAVRKFGGVK